MAETDDALMEKYLEGEELSYEELMAGIRKATIAGTLTPVLCGTSYRNKGVQPFLDAIVDFLPSPLDIPPVEGTKKGSDEVVARKADDKEPFSALAFKIMADPFVGKLVFFRVYSGCLKSGSYVYNSTKGKRERIGRILRMHATTARRWMRSTPATSPPPWASRRPLPAIRSARRATPSSSRAWSSPSRSSAWPLSPRPRPVRTR